MSFDWISIGELIIILLVSITWHELAHAFTAQYLGDDTPRRTGHMSLNPFNHMDQYGIVLLFLSTIFSNGTTGFAYGFTPVNERNLRPNAKTGGGIVAIVGPISNLVLAALIAIPLRLDGLNLFMTNRGLFDFALNAVSLNVLLAVFNMLPLPPLDGWRVLATFLSARTLYDWRNFIQYGPVILFGLFLLQQYVPVIPWLVTNAVVPITSALSNVPI